MADTKKTERIGPSRISGQAICQTPVGLFQQEVPEGKIGKIKTWYMKIFVKVKPRAKEEKVEKIDGINFKVQVRQPPEKGRANLAVIRVLADYFGVSQSNIQIVSG